MILLFIFLAAFPLPALGNALDLYCGGVLEGTFEDGSPGDLDPDPNEIEIDFTCVDASADWLAQGLARGIFIPNVSAKTEITELTIENITGNFSAGNFRITHNDFALITGNAIFTNVTLDGFYDNVAGAPLISVADVNMALHVNGLFVDFADPPPAQAVPPIVPFFDILGPSVDFEVFSHDHIISFYLDSLGDAIVLPDSLVMFSSEDDDDEDDDSSGGNSILERSWDSAEGLQDLGPSRP